MLEWCFAHPWMTFFIILAFIEVVIGNIFRVINNYNIIKNNYKSKDAEDIE